MIQALRNASFPDHQAPRSYYNQKPHYRHLEYEGESLIGHMGLDYRTIGVDGDGYNILGIIDFCVRQDYRGDGMGSIMLSNLARYAQAKAVDFTMLVADLDNFYLNNGYQKVTTQHAWLRINEFGNHGVANEPVDDFYVKPVSGIPWPAGHVDWLGYMF